MPTATQTQAAFEAYEAHPWDPETRLCKCGEFFEATREGNHAHAVHRIAQTVAAAEVADVFCDQCDGPYEGWLKQYGGHWDTCPNRAQAIVDVSPEYYQIAAEEAEEDFLRQSEGAPEAGAK